MNQPVFTEQELKHLEDTLRELLDEGFWNEAELSIVFNKVYAANHY